MFSERLRLSQVRVYLATAHWETAKGTPKQNREYCTKPETRVGEFCEIGIFPETARVNEMTLLNFIPLLRMDCDTPTMSNSTSDLWVKYPNLLTYYQSASILPRSAQEETHAWLYIGPPEQAKADSLIDTLSLSSETWSSESSQESGGMDIEERKPSYGTIFEDITALSQTLNFVLIDTPSSGSQRDYM